ncbi:MAG: MarR family transcriptional regulator [Candidatus Omnitrophota bacterium]
MSNIGLSEFADKLNEIIPILMRGLARQQANELFKGKITLPQFLILEFLQHKGESTMTSLAKFMGITPAAMTGIIDRLVKYSYCLRKYETQDRRVIKIGITPKAADLLKRINQERRQMVIKVFGKISEKDRQDYLRVITKVKEIVSKENGSPR